MRIIEVSDAPIRSVTVAPDGRLVAASAADAFGLFDWLTGEPVLRSNTAARVSQFAFTPDGLRLVCCWTDQPLVIVDLANEFKTEVIAPHTAGGVAVSPDGRKVVATQRTTGDKARLSIWELPGLKARSGFDDWPPFGRLAYSRNGESIAGIWPGVPRRFQSVPAKFEIRFAQSGGVDYRYPPALNGPVYAAPGFVSFTRDSGTCAFGWVGEFHVLDLSTGTTRYVRRVPAEYTGAGFTGSGRHFATVDGSGSLKLWDARTWEVVHEYNWQCGPLTCVGFTADGSAGVCGTEDGRLVQFDVDE